MIFFAQIGHFKTTDRDWITNNVLMITGGLILLYGNYSLFTKTNNYPTFNFSGYNDYF